MAVWSDEVTDDGLLARTIFDDPIGLFRDDSGRAVALRDRCAHRFVSLSMGDALAKVSRAAITV